MIKYKIDILAELKKKGYSSYKLRKDKIFGERTMTLIRKKVVVYGATLDKLCELLNCQVGDILEYVPTNPTEQEQKEQTEEPD